MRISAVRAPTYIRVRLWRRGRKRAEDGKGRERERERNGSLHNVNPACRDCKCGVKTDVNIRTNGGVAGVRNGEYAVYWGGGGEFNELKKIKGHASVSASRVNPSIRFEDVLRDEGENPSSNRSRLSWAKFMDVASNGRASDFRLSASISTRSMMNNAFRL